MKSIWFYLHGHVGLTSRVFTVLIVENGSVANKWFLLLLPWKKSYLNCVWSVFTDFRPLTQVSRNCLFFGGEGGWGIHISPAAILEGLHIYISLVICVRGYTYHGGTHITAAPATPRTASTVMTGHKGNSQFCLPETRWGRGQTKLTVSRGASH